MGVLYIVLPLDERVRGWLANEGVFVPDDAVDGRWPTEAELRAALAAMPGWTVRYRETSKGWDAEISERRSDGSSRGTTLWVTRAVDGSVERFSFEKGWQQLAVALLAKLAARCGALVIAGDGENPVLVTEGTDPDAQ